MREALDRALNDQHISTANRHHRAGRSERDGVALRGDGNRGAVAARNPQVEGSTPDEIRHLLNQDKGAVFLRLSHLK